MPSIGIGLATLLSGVIGTGAGVAGGLLSGDDGPPRTRPQERHIFRGENGERLDESLARFLNDALREELGKSVERAAMTDRVKFDVPKVSTTQTATAQALLPATGRFATLGQVPGLGGLPITGGGGGLGLLASGSPPLTSGSPPPTGGVAGGGGVGLANANVSQQREQILRLMNNIMQQGRLVL